jgi:hypothetical protein
VIVIGTTPTPHAALKGEKMSALSNEEIAIKKAKLIEAFKDPDLLLLPQDEQCEQLEISRVTLWKWKKEISPAEWEKIRDGARATYAQHAPLVDMALIEKAKKGDPKSIELFFQRYEGWSVKQNMEILNKTDLAALSKEQLLEKVHEIMGKKGPIEPKLEGIEEKKAENG